MRKSYSVLILFVILTLFIYARSIFMFFAQDDFWLLKISQGKTVQDILFFFVPRPDAVWYRPLSSQFFFFVSKFIFGLNPIGYHSIVLVTHSLTSLTILKLVKQVSKDNKTAFIAGLFYVLHQAHTVSVSWLATYAFVIGPLFLSLMLLLYVRGHNKGALICFVLGLLSHEIALIGIGFIWLCNKLLNPNKGLKQLIPYLCISIVVILLRFLLFPTSILTSAYTLEFSIRMFDTMKFYLLRVYGVPWFFDGMPIKLQIVVLFLLCMYSAFLLLQFKHRRHIVKHKTTLYWASICILGLLPFLLFPEHVAPHYLSFSLIGFSALLAELATYTNLKFNMRKVVLPIAVFVAVFILLNLIGSQWTYNTHWIFRRAELAKKLVSKRDFVQPVGSEAYFALGAESAQEVFK